MAHNSPRIKEWQDQLDADGMQIWSYIESYKFATSESCGEHQNHPPVTRKDVDNCIWLGRLDSFYVGLSMELNVSVFRGASAALVGHSAGRRYKFLHAARANGFGAGSERKVSRQAWCCFNHNRVG